MILITGINGFIAKNLHEKLIQEYKLSENDIFGTLKEDSENIVDILNEKAPEYIYHIGAEINDNDKMFESNVVLTYKILEYCRNAKNLKRLIIIGSSSEYGRKINPMSENDSLEPETIYEGTKSACTMLARAYSHTYNINILIIRPFSIYGIGERSNRLMQILLKKIKNNDKSVSVSDGFHDYVYIDDFTEALLEIVNKNETRFDIINIGSGIQTSNKEIVMLFENINNYKFDEYLTLPQKEYDSNNWVCDINKLNNFYKMKLSLKDGIIKMCNYYK